MAVARNRFAATPELRSSLSTDSIACVQHFEELKSLRSNFIALQSEASYLVKVALSFRRELTLATVDAESSRLLERSAVSLLEESPLAMLGCHNYQMYSVLSDSTELADYRFEVYDVNPSEQRSLTKLFRKLVHFKERLSSWSEVLKHAPGHVPRSMLGKQASESQLKSQCQPATQSEADAAIAVTTSHQQLSLVETVVLVTKIIRERLQLIDSICNVVSDLRTAQLDAKYSGFCDDSAVDASLANQFASDLHLDRLASSNSSCSSSSSENRLVGRSAPSHRGQWTALIRQLTNACDPKQQPQQQIQNAFWTSPQSAVEEFSVRDPFLGRWDHIDGKSDYSSQGACVRSEWSAAFIDESIGSSTSFLALSEIQKKAKEISKEILVQKQKNLEVMREKVKKIYDKHQQMIQAQIQAQIAKEQQMKKEQEEKAEELRKKQQLLREQEDRKIKEKEAEQKLKGDNQLQLQKEQSNENAKASTKVPGNVLGGTKTPPAVVTSNVVPSIGSFSAQSVNVSANNESTQQPKGGLSSLINFGTAPSTSQRISKEELENLLLNFYRTHDPGKASKVDELVKKHASDPIPLLNKFVKQYSTKFTSTLPSHIVKLLEQQPTQNSQFVQPQQQQSPAQLQSTQSLLLPKSVQPTQVSWGQAPSASLLTSQANTSPLAGWGIVQSAAQTGVTSVAGNGWGVGNTGSSLFGGGNQPQTTSTSSQSTSFVSSSSTSSSPFAGQSWSTNTSTSLTTSPLLSVGTVGTATTSWGAQPKPTGAGALAGMGFKGQPGLLNGSSANGGSLFGGGAKSLFNK